MSVSSLVDKMKQGVETKGEVTRGVYTQSFVVKLPTNPTFLRIASSIFTFTKYQAHQDPYCTAAGLLSCRDRIALCVHFHDA